MSDDWEGLGSEDGGYDEYLSAPGPQTPPLPKAPPPTPTGPLISPLHLGAAPAPAPKRGLGDFSPAGICELRSLAKLSYLFLNNVSLGDTQKALAALGVFRYLFNDSRNTLLPGFPAAMQAILPVSVPDVSWSAEMQRAMGLSLVGALGATNTALRTAVSNLPGSMAALASWFPTFRASLAPGDFPAITDYASAPVITSMDYGRQIAQLVTEELRGCLPSSVPAPTVQYVPGTPQGLAPLAPAGGGGGGSSITPAGTGSSSSGGGSAQPASTGGIGVATVAILALAGYGAYLAFKDSKEMPKRALGALPPGKSWLPGDLGARGPEFQRLNARAERQGRDDGKKAAKEVECIPTSVTKRSFSMDEWGGPSAEKLNAAIVRLSQQVTGARPDLSPKLRHDVEHELEDTYFQAYTQSLRAHGAKAGTCE